MIAQSAREGSGILATAEDRREFERAFRDVSRSAFLLARQLGRSPDQSLDIVQEAALRAWRYRRTRRGEFRPWFLAIVYRQARGHVPEWLPLPARWDRPAESAIASAMDPDLVTALSRIPSRQRAALWLRYCEDLAVSDVARIMRCSDTAAKQLLLRGRDALRASLRPREEKT